MRIYPDLEVQPFYDAQELPLVRDLEAHAPEILTEALALEPLGFQDEAEPILRRGTWSVMFLYERGRRNEEHCRRAPVTAAIIERHRTHRTIGGLAYFSNLAPNTYVSPHYGPTNLRIRVHLGLDVPPDCGLMVDGQAARWEEGRGVAFSDRFLHEVWNWSDRRRLVLVVDLWHPDLSDREVELIDGLYRYALAEGDRVQQSLLRNDAVRATARASR
jgi:aspartate beta-hydroxylase